MTIKFGQQVVKGLRLYALQTMVLFQVNQTFITLSMHEWKFVLRVRACVCVEILVKNSVDDLHRRWLVATANHVATFLTLHVESEKFCVLEIYVFLELSFYADVSVIISSLRRRRAFFFYNSFSIAFFSFLFHFPSCTSSSFSLSFSSTSSFHFRLGFRAIYNAFVDNCIVYVYTLWYRA